MEKNFIHKAEKTMSSRKSEGLWMKNLPDLEDLAHLHGKKKLSTLQGKTKEHLSYSVRSCSSLQSKAISSVYVQAEQLY